MEKYGLTAEDLRSLQNSLLIDPGQGDTLTRRGVRKTRFARPGRGKSGDARIIYADIAEKETILLLAVFLKKNQQNLTHKQKQVIDELVERIKEDL